MELPFGIGAYTGRSTTINALELRNLMVEVDNSGGDKLSLFRRPGTKEWLDIGNGAHLRGQIVAGDYLYAVSGNYVYKIDKSKSKTQLGTISTSVGRVNIISNGVQLLITDNTKGYTIRLSDDDFSRIRSSSFVGVTKTVFQDGYGIAIKPDSGKFQISALYDFGTWNSLDYATAEGYPDDLVSVLSAHSDLWLFGADSTEIDYNLNAQDFPFTRKFIVEEGCAAQESPVKLDNTVFWLTSNRQVARATGYTPSIISTRNLEHKWSKYDFVDDAVGIGFTYEGHPLYILTFPSVGASWVYDVSTQQWYIWDSFQDSSIDRWRFRADNYAYFHNKHLVGDYANGKIYELKDDCYTDDGWLIPAVFTSVYADADRERVPHIRLEVCLEQGVGYVDYLVDVYGRQTLDGDNEPTKITSGSWSNPQIMMQYSDNDGRSWSNEKWADIASVAKRGIDRTMFRRLGSSRKRIYRFMFSDATKFVVEKVMLNGS